MIKNIFIKIIIETGFIFFMLMLASVIIKTWKG